MADKIPDRIPLGKPPPEKRLAFWYLSHEAHRLLAEKREQGLFGGTPGKAPYWYVVDQGSEGAAIEASYYIARAMGEFEAQVGRMVSEYFRF